MVDGQEFSCYTNFVKVPSPGRQVRVVSLYEIVMVTNPVIWAVIVLVKILCIFCYGWFLMSGPTVTEPSN